jgi:hypothetical protein
MFKRFLALTNVHVTCCAAQVNAATQNDMWPLHDAIQATFFLATDFCYKQKLWAPNGGIKAEC